MDTGLFVYRSDRLEELAEALATVLQQAPLPPLQNETILVPNLGLARWLRQQLASRDGIAAGLDMPFPGAWLQRLDRAHDTAPDLFHGDVLLFRLWRLFDDPALQKRLGPAAAYVADDRDQRKRLQLCQRLGRCFDDYQLYRPELLQAFASDEISSDLGPHADWQAELWRELLRDAGMVAGPTPPAPKRRGRPKPEPSGPLLFGPLPPATPIAKAPAAHRLAALSERLQQRTSARALQPQRLIVFGASTLAPPFLDLLTTLAHHQLVHLFVPSAVPPSPHLPSATLWERFGGEAREFHELLDRALANTPTARLDAELAGSAQRAPLPKRPSLLQWLQFQLVSKDMPGTDAAQNPTLVPPPAADDSLRVHSCHSPQRELEVVRDQILAAFAADRELQPHDVLVLVPDIRRYAPFAHAVFGPVQEHLPFHVADKSPASDLPLCRTLLALLDLASERLEVHAVLHVLEQPAVQQRFRIFAGDLPGLRARCQRAGIRWGLDGEARARQFKVPPFEENSWRLGIDRLLTGVATGAVDELVLGMLPVADATASRDELLVRFVHFTDTLFVQLRQLQQPQAAAQWAQRLDELLTAMFAPADADDEAAVALMRTVLARLRRSAEAANCRTPLSRAMLREWLEGALTQQPSQSGFLAGAVTVAALLPMRAVPCRRIFVCGLDDASFPRRDPELPFDLIHLRRRAGDRSLRLDDRQMFLDLLLAARESLHLCYVGRSQKDDAEIMPSAVVSELLDWLDERAAAAELPALRRGVVVEHPLQPWSRRYRDGSDTRLFTYSRAELEPSQLGAPVVPWCDGEVEPPAELLGNSLAIDTLLEFWKHPGRFFLRRVLGIRLLRSDDPEPLTEPFHLGNLERWQVNQVLLARVSNNPTAEAADRAYLLASGTLPVGGVGACALPKVEDEVRDFSERLQRHGPRRTARLRIEFDGIELAGEVPGIASDQLVVERLASLQPKDELRSWILHVIAAVARHRGAELPAHTCIVAKDKQKTLQPLPQADAEAALRTLLRGFQTGLRRPLLYLEKASGAFGTALQKRGSAPSNREAALAAAIGSWQPQPPDRQFTSDRYDADVQLCWRGREPLQDPAFAVWAHDIWRPFSDFAAKTP